MNDQPRTQVSRTERRWRWVKLPLDLLHSPLYGRLNDHLYRRATELRLIAAQANNGGALPPLVDISWTLRTDTEDLEQDCILLEEVGILNRLGQVWHFATFEADQAPSDPTAAERMRRYRERQEEGKSDRNVTRNVTRDVTRRGRGRGRERGRERETSAHPKDGCVDARPHTGRTTTVTPPSILAYREQAHTYPKKPLWAEIALAVGEDPESLKLWGDIVHAWIAHGWNPGNITGMLEVFKTGHVPVSTRGYGDGAEPKGFAGIREALSSKEARNG